MTVNMHAGIWTNFLIFTQFHLSFGGKGDEDLVSLAQTERNFSDHALINVLREADEFHSNLTAVKDASASLGHKLNELQSALTQTGAKSTSLIPLPIGWDKSALIDALAKALIQNKQFQELGDRFERFIAEINKLRPVDGKGQLKGKINGTGRLRNKTKGFPLPSSIQGKLVTLDNSTLMGKLVGFVKTGRRLDTFTLSQFTACTNASCDFWRRGLEALRTFFSKSDSEVIDYFKNSAALRQLIDELGGSNATVPPKETERPPVDYFDYYYNHDDNSTRKVSSVTTNRTNIQINNLKLNASNNVLNEAGRLVDYFDYYYNQGIPAIIGDKAKFSKEPAGD